MVSAMRTEKEIREAISLIEMHYPYLADDPDLYTAAGMQLTVLRWVLGEKDITDEDSFTELIENLKTTFTAKRKPS